MKELNIFIDESGDFGEYDYHAPYYNIDGITCQNNSVEHDLAVFETEDSFLIKRR